MVAAGVRPHMIQLSKSSIPPEQDWSKASPPIEQTTPALRKGRAAVAEMVSTALALWSPRYNAGDALGCARAYRDVAVTVMASEIIGADLKVLLESALKQEDREFSASHRAWTLRSALDATLNTMLCIVTPTRDDPSRRVAGEASHWGRAERCVSADSITGPVLKAQAKTTAARGQLGSLPPELIDLIFAELGMRTLSVAARVCVAWADQALATARLRLSSKKLRSLDCDRVLGHMGWMSILEAVERLEQCAGPKPVDQNWWNEWPALRAEEMMCSGQPSLARTENFDRGGPDSLRNLLKQYSLTLAWMVDAGWPPLDAAACICLNACRTALARQLQQLPSMHTGGALKHAASSHTIAEILRDRASRVDSPAPLAYASFCCGPSGLAECDEAWFALVDSSATAGACIRTSVMLKASSDPFVVDGLGAPTSFGAVETGWDRLASPVICVRSERPSGGRLRSLVQASPYLYLLPPLATVTLEKVDQPGQWEVHGRTIWRSCYTVRVSHS